MYLRLTCRVGSLTSYLQCFLSSLFLGYIDRLVLSNIFGWSCIFHRFSILPVRSFQSNFLSRIYICSVIEEGRVPFLLIGLCSLPSPSVVSSCVMLLCSGAILWILGFFGLSMQCVTSSDLVTLAPSAIRSPSDYLSKWCYVF